MVTGTEEVIGKRVWAYVPMGKNLQKREGSIEKFVDSSPSPLYMVKYDGWKVLAAARPEWLILAPNE